MTEVSTALGVPSSQAAGTVARPGSVPIEIRAEGLRGGNSLLPEIFEAVSERLTNAGLGGTFFATCRIRTKTIVVPPVKGLHVCSPERCGVPMVWCNDGGEAEFVLKHPNGMTPIAFYGLLANPLDIRGPDEDPPPGSKEETVMGQPRFRRFIDDTKKLEGLKQALFRRVSLTGFRDGRISHGECINTIPAFGPTSGGIGSTLKSLVHHGYLARVDEVWLRFAGPWLEEFLQSRSLPLPPPEIADETFLAKLASLAETVRAGQEQRKRLGEVASELEELEAKLASLLARQTELTSTRVELARTFDEERLASAEKLLEPFKGLV